MRFAVHCWKYQDEADYEGVVSRGSPVYDAAALGWISAGAVTEPGDGEDSRDGHHVLDPPLHHLAGDGGLPGVPALDVPGGGAVLGSVGGAGLAGQAGHVGDGVADLLGVGPALGLVDSGALALHDGGALEGGVKHYVMDVCGVFVVRPRSLVSLGPCLHLLDCVAHLLTDNQSN